MKVFIKNITKLINFGSISEKICVGSGRDAIIKKMEQEAKKYICEKCKKEAGQVYAIKESKKVKWLCQKCFYKNK